jgi:hypothetical protein
VRPDDRNVPVHEGAVAVLLTATSFLAFLGLRYPAGRAAGRSGSRRSDGAAAIGCLL